MKMILSQRLILQVRTFFHASSFKFRVLQQRGKGKNQATGGQRKVETNADRPNTASQRNIDESEASMLPKQLPNGKYEYVTPTLSSMATLKASSL